MSTAAKEARAVLDDAIRAYCAAIDTTAEEQGPFLPTGWGLIISGVRGTFNDDDGTAFISETSAALPYHAALGLWTRALDGYRFGWSLARGGDE